MNEYTYTMQAADNAGIAEATRERIRYLVAGEMAADRFVTKVLGRHVGLS